MTSESPTHPDAPRAGGETPDTRPALDLEATLNLLRDLADEEGAAICGDPHCPCGQAAKREGLLRDLVEHLSASPSLRSSLSDGATDENLKDLNWLIDYSVRDGRDRITLSIDQARYFAARLALLERHRDGERLDWLEHCNSQKRGEVPILPPSCGYSVRQYIDRQLADANTPCAAPPSPERASK